MTTTVSWPCLKEKQLISCVVFSKNGWSVIHSLPQHTAGRLVFWSFRVDCATPMVVSAFICCQDFRSICRPNVALVVAALLRTNTTVHGLPHCLQNTDTVKGRSCLRARRLRKLNSHVIKRHSGNNAFLDIFCHEGHVCNKVEFACRQDTQREQLFQ